MDQLIQPNWHIALIHLPLGLLVVGSLIELFSVFWRRSVLRISGQYMILIGALLGVPAALSGIHALYDVASAGVEPGLYWYETVAASRLTDDAWLLLTRHVYLMAAGVGIYLLVSLWYLASSDPGRRKWYIVRWLLLLIGLATLTAGAWHGGEAVHRQRITADAALPITNTSTLINVLAAAETPAETPTTAPADLTPTTAPTTLPTTNPLSLTLPDSMKHLQRISWWYGWAIRIAPPLELHVAAAGVAYSMGLLAVALALRNANVVRSTANAVNPKRSALAVSRPTVTPPVVPMDAPAKRALLIALLTVVLAASAGWWVLAETAGQYIPIRLWRMVAVGLEDPDLRRRIVHVGGAGVLGFVPLASLLFAWLAPRKRWPLVLLGMLLVATAASQTYVGILLMYDGPRGPAWKFNQPPEPPPQPLGPVVPAAE